MWTSSKQLLSYSLKSAKSHLEKWNFDGWHSRRRFVTCWLKITSKSKNNPKMRDIFGLEIVMFGSTVLVLFGRSPTVVHFPVTNQQLYHRKQNIFCYRLLLNYVYLLKSDSDENELRVLLNLLRPKIECISGCIEKNNSTPNESVDSAHTVFIRKQSRDIISTVEGILVEVAGLQNLQRGVSSLCFYTN